MLSECRSPVESCGERRAPATDPIRVGCYLAAQLAPQLLAEVNAELSAELSAEVLAEVPAEVPAGVPAKVPSEVPAGVPAEVPEEVLEEMPAEVHVVPAALMIMLCRDCLARGTKVNHISVLLPGMSNARSPLNSSSMAVGLTRWIKLSPL